MELVKLKMKTVYKTFLLVILVLLIFVVSLGVISLFYNGVLKRGSYVEAVGDLSINYLDGKSIRVNGNDTIKFSITNVSEMSYSFNLRLLKVRGSGSYKLKSNNEVISEGEIKTTDEIQTSQITIIGSETKEFELEISCKEKVGFEIDIYGENNQVIIFKDTILNDNRVSSDSLTKVGYDIASEDEGLIKSSDDAGVSYYFRGNVVNNYVSFADKTWRIVRINGDGTVRLVLNGVAGLSTYYDSEKKDFAYNNSKIKEYLDGWFNDNLVNNVSNIANGKFCSDILKDEMNNYNAYLRVYTNKIPALNCLGESFNSNIGLLSIDEVIFAGANTQTLNANFYLINTDIKEEWYTLSAAKGNDDKLNMFMINTNGSIDVGTEGDLYRYVRPVINLVKNVEVEGNGTKDNPYVIVEK